MSKEQIIRLMKSGWELGRSHNGRWWIQKDGLGSGGESNNVHANTARSLLNNKIIKSKGYGFPSEQFILAGGV